MAIVFPGDALVLASSLPFVSFCAPVQSILISEDLPTFDLPINAISGSLRVGFPFMDVLLPEKAAFVIFIGFCFAANLENFSDLFVPCAA